MAEKADDLGVPQKMGPAVGTTMLHRVADPPRSTTVPPREPGSSLPPTEQSVGPHGHEVDRRTLIIGEGISLSGEVTSCDRLIVEGLPSPEGATMLDKRAWAQKQLNRLLARARTARGSG